MCDVDAILYIIGGDLLGYALYGVGGGGGRERGG